METVRLKSRVGPLSFKDTVRIILPDGKVTYERKEFVFSMDNDCRCDVPRKTWERLEHEYLQRGRKGNLKYGEALIEL